MIRVTVPLVMALALLLAPVGASAGQVEGTIQGLICVTQGKVCPIDKEDPIIAAERIFVVLVKPGHYYFVPNLDRAVLARHIGERVKVTGEVDEKYKSIKASKLEVWKNGSWKTTWSKELEEEIQKMYRFGT